MATLVCRIQYLDDRDPFASTNFPEPTRPPSYKFLLSVPLINQIGGVHRVLDAPHRVSHCNSLVLECLELLHLADEETIELSAGERKHVGVLVALYSTEWVSTQN